MNTNMKKRLLSLPLALSLLLALASPAALAAESAATIKLSKTSGTVSVSKSSEKPLTLMSNMRLYNGYHVTTGAGSYAWINLDDTKLIKQDVSSEVEVRKSGKKLEVNVCSGNVFFNISEKLKDDESLNISTSTMIVGIRGTAGYVEMEDRWTTKISILEGSAQCSVTDPVTGQTKTATVNGGETATCVVYSTEPGGTEGPGAGEPGTETSGPEEKCDILMERQTVETTPGFVLTDVVRDMTLCEKIQEDTGTDVLAELAQIVGGDPSGKSADGQSASPEVLGEADRREASQAASRQEQQQQAERVQASEDTAVSADKALDPKPEAPSSDGGSSSGSNTPPGPVTVNRTMPITAADLQTALNGADVVNLQQNTADASANTLTVESAAALNVAGGKTLNLGSGVDMVVEGGGALSVAGTVTGNNVTNNGDITVSSSNTLYVKGDLTGAGKVTVTATGRLVVDGIFRPASLILNAGAQVLSKLGFGSVSLPAGWYATGTGSYNGSNYTALEYLEPHTVTFDPNGGALSGGNTAVTGAGGKLSALPAAPSRSANTGGTASYTFGGWWTAAEGGTEVTTDTAFPADTTVYAHWTIESGWDWALNGASLTVSGTGAMTDFGNAAPPWGAGITGVTIEAGITTVGNSAFNGCASLTSVTLPAGLTIIGGGAFTGCTGLAAVTIPDGVTDIGDEAFANCTALTGVTLPGSVANIGYQAFDGCAGLNVLTFQGTRDQWAKVKVPSGAIPDATTIRCSDGALAAYTVTFDPNGGTLTAGGSSTTDLLGKLSALPTGDDFSAPRQANTGGTASYTFGGWWTAAEGGTEVTTDTAFPANTTVYAHWSIESGWDWAYTDEAQTALRIFGTGEMTDYGGGGVPWDDNLNGITSLTVEAGITNIGASAFAGCGQLASVTLPSTVTMIGGYAFQGCTALRSVTFSGTPAFDNLGLGSFAFAGCTSLTSFTIPNGVTQLQQYTFDGCIGLTSVTIPDSVTILSEYAFQNCSSLRSLTIPISVTSVSAAAFTGCSDLTISYGGTQAQWDNVCKDPLPNGVTVAFGAYTVTFNTNLSTYGGADTESTSTTVTGGVLPQLPNASTAPTGSSGAAVYAFDGWWTTPMTPERRSPPPPCSRRTPPPTPTGP